MSIPSCRAFCGMLSDSLPGVTVLELPCLEMPFVPVDDWGVRGPPPPPEEEDGRPPECFRLATERKNEKTCLKHEHQ